MNILFLEGDMSRRGGTERMTSILSNLLVNTHRVHVMSLHFQGEKIAFPLNPQVIHHVLRCQNGASNILKVVRELRKFNRAHGIDCIINVDTGMGIYGILAAIGLKTKVITWEHSNFFNNWDSSIFPYLRRFAAKFSDAFVVLTEKDKRNYMDHTRTKVPIVVIPNPVEMHESYYDLNSKTILSAGMLVPIKGYDIAIQVAKKVFSQRPDWKWVICGEGPEREHLEEQILQEGLGNNVFLPGNVVDMSDEYQHAAMFVLTSKMEGLPMVLLEAKSWGIPIVSFDIMTGPSDIIRDGENGFLVEPENVDVMVKKMLQLISDEELRRSFADKSNLDLDKFSVERVKEQWETVLKNL